METKDEEPANEYLFAVNRHETQSVHDTVSIHDHHHETDDGHVSLQNAGNGLNAAPLTMVSGKNTSIVDEDEEFMNELKEEEVSAHSRGMGTLEEEEVENGGTVHVVGADKSMLLGNGSALNPKPMEHSEAVHGHRTTENEMKFNKKTGTDPNGEEKEMEGGFAVPPQRLLVLVPQAIEFKTITGILPCNTQTFTFSKKLDISGVVCPSFTHEQQESMQEAPGEQNRLYIVQCGTGLVAPSMSIGTLLSIQMSSDSATV